MKTKYSILLAGLLVAGLACTAFAANQEQTPEEEAHADMARTFTDACRQIVVFTGQACSQSGQDPRAVMMKKYEAWVSSQVAGGRLSKTAGTTLAFGGLMMYDDFSCDGHDMLTACLNKMVR